MKNISSKIIIQGNILFYAGYWFERDWRILIQKFIPIDLTLHPMFFKSFVKLEIIRQTSIIFNQNNLWTIELKLQKEEKNVQDEKYLSDK